MTTKLKEDNCLTIQLLSYDRPTLLTERYYFLEMSTCQVTTLLQPDSKIIVLKIVAYTHDNQFLDDETISTFKTIGRFNDFFCNNPEYYIHNCNIELENGIHVGSHDDGEVTIEFSSDNSNEVVIHRVFEKYNLDKKLIDILKNKCGHYIAIDRENKVTATFDNFDDYIENG